MKLSVSEDYFFQLREVYNGVELITEEENTMLVCMRDDTFEFTVTNIDGVKNYRVDMSNLKVNEV